jgi:hypothetical protein
MIKLKCVDCGHTKNVFESEVMDNTECPICKGKMLLEESADYIKEQKKESEKIKTESEGLDGVLDNQLINTMVNELEQFGEAKVFAEINNLDIELRLRILPIFIEAKYQYNKGKLHE